MSDIAGTKSIAAVRDLKPIEKLRAQMEARQLEFKAALPAHIPAERFVRVVMTACQQTPELVFVDRRSLFTSCMKCAQDGLLPDGREAALVIYKDRNRGPIAQYLVMIAGIRKKVRNSGEIATWDAQVVHENDAFEFELGDDPFIKHRPALSDRGKPIAAYSICTLKSGEKSREVMSIADINAIRARSRAKDTGPWVTDYDEMARKTVAKRHSKVLPMSSDLDDLLRRDDDLYDYEHAKDQKSKPKAIAERFDETVDPDGRNDGGDDNDPPPSNGNGRGKSIADRLNDLAKQPESRGRSSDEGYRGDSRNEAPPLDDDDLESEPVDYDMETGEIRSNTGSDVYDNNDPPAEAGGEAAEAPADDPIDEKTAKLFTAAAKRAKESQKKLTAYLNTLHDDDFKRLEPYFTELRDIAAKAEELRK